MSRSASVIILLSLTASASAFEWEENLETARRKASEEWRPVFVFFAEMNKATRIIEMNTFDNDNVIKMLEKPVCVRVDPFEEETLAKAFGLKIALAVGMMSPGGKVYSSHEGPPRPEHVLQVVKEGLEKHGPIPDKTMLQNVQAKVERARHWMEQKRYDNALLEINRIGRLGMKSGPAAQAAEIRREIEQKADETLERAIEKEKTSPLKARKIFETVKRDFRGLPASTRAAEHLDALAKRGIIDLRKVRIQANALYKKGLRFERMKRFPEAIEMYKKIFSLPSTEFTTTAEAAIERLENDPEVAAAIDRAEIEKEARALLRRARMWEQNNRNKQAKEIYQRIINEFPETTACEQAYEAVRRLRVY